PMIEPLNGYHKFLKGKMEFIITPDLPLVLADFLKKCTSRDPAKRCSSEDLLAHPYLQGIAVSANPSAETMNKMYTF
ncbi:hypothetical protein NEMIN01_1833, partial [Nematocida minor]|uniref:uncharacterized protein n=1 Tax=Nematocida minor TaxID=1912983 RepID=UPI002220EA47